MAKGVKTGGRKKGTPNKSTAAQLALVEQSAKEGITPLDVMLRTMRILWNETEAVDAKTGKVVISVDKAKEAVAVASAAAPYCHAKIAQKEEVIPPPDVEEVDLQDAGRRIAFALAAAEREPKALPKPKAKQPA